jgi:hypothetical protein
MCGDYPSLLSERLRQRDATRWRSLRFALTGTLLRRQTLREREQSLAVLKREVLGSNPRSQVSLDLISINMHTYSLPAQEIDNLAL